MGGYITGIIGLLIFPWKLISDPTGFIFTWLIAYSSLLGPIGGIMIVDYFFIRNQILDVDDLYQFQGKYTFSGGFNFAAFVALVIGILPNIPGFLIQIKVLESQTVWPWLADLYNYSWFVGFFLSGLAYLLMMKKDK